MKMEYVSWISDNYPTSWSATLQCDKATKRMVEQFPELKRVRGMAHVKEPHGLPPTKTPHWWLVTPDNEIVDPVAHQYLLGIVKYVPADESQGPPTGKCLNCGNLCYKKKDVCSKTCADRMEEIYRDRFS